MSGEKCPRIKCDNDDDDDDDGFGGWLLSVLREKLVALQVNASIFLFR